MASKAKTRPLRVKQEKRTKLVLVKEARRSKMEEMALEYDVLCASTEDVRKREGKLGWNFINMIDNRLPAIEGMLSTSEPQNINDLFIYTVLVRSKLASVRDNANPIIHPEEYGSGDRTLTIEDYQTSVGNIMIDIADLQSMISRMMDGMERVSGTTAKRLGIGRIASSSDGSDRA